ncbi:IS481 family transposase [Flagellimonas sp.]|uniref:IS481 family transposase n=1 Tax=Flagellimonas sp. TaxID=2058762 RepID=UPI003B506735
MDLEQKKRLKWIRLYEEYGDAGKVCLKCGISRPTLRKWLKRFREDGVDGLKDQSRKPLSSPNAKVDFSIEKLILDYRNKRKLGARRLQIELLRNEDIKLSLATIHKVLKRNNCKPLCIKRVKQRKFIRYSRPVPGERIQMDTCKIAPSIYQFTAIDDCTRFQVVKLYPRRTASNTLDFLEKVVEEMPFPIQRIQTDRGREFFALKVQKKLMEWGIKFRPIKPRSPHLNGKVERVQKTDLQEFYAVEDLKDPKLSENLEYWQFHYNWHRPHSSLNGKTPMEKVCELSSKTPLWDDVETMYDGSRERIQEQNYIADLALRKLIGKDNPRLN